MTFKQIVHHLNRRDFRLFPKLSSTLKISLVILLVFSVFLTTKTIFAQEAANPIKVKQDAMLKGNNQESWLDNAMGTNLMSTQILIGGTFPDSVLNGELPRRSNAYIPGGAISVANRIVASTYTPMASGVEYIAKIKDNFLGKPAYAASSPTGFEGLSGIMNLWKMSRNIVYTLISLTFVILGIMIMLRIKISPQAVVTVQSSLPKVITTLILVTFSYAIAGLCIDLINFIQPFAIVLLFNTLGKGLNENLFPLSWGDFSFTGLVNAIRALFGDNAFDYNSLVKTNFWGVFSMTQRLAPSLSLMALGALVGGVIVGFSNPVAALGGAGIGAVLVTLVISLIIMIYIIKLIAGLAKCYLTILLKIIFAPFEIFMGIFPASKAGFSKWITELIANLVVFPICLLFLILANILTQNMSGGLWAPTLIIGPVSWFLPVIVGIAAIALLSKLPSLIPEAVFNIKPSPFGKAIGEAMKPIGSAAKFGARGGAQYGADVVERKYKAATSPGKGLTFLNTLRKTATTAGIVKDH